MLKKIIAGALCVMLMLSMLAACGSSDTPAPADSGSTAGDTQPAGTSSDGGDTAAGNQGSSSKYEEFLTIDVFSAQANYQGIQGGWFGKLVRDKFNMELNIIAPNVAGGGDTLFQTRSAAGNLGDLIMTAAKDGRLQDLVTAELIIDLTPYLTDAENLMGYYDALTHISGTLVEEEGIWCAPAEVSKRAATEPLSGTDLNFGIYIRWDLYKEMGYPEMNTLEDLLPMLKDMQELCPESDSGQKVYGFSMWKDWDSNSMSYAGFFPPFYGYGGLNFVSTKGDDSTEPWHTLQDGSLYLRSLKFLFDANQMGLVDPESTTQNYDTVWQKHADGAVLFSPFPWSGQAAYNTQNHIEQGKGVMPADIKDFEIYHWGCYSKGNPELGMMVGSKAKDPQRMVDFIDWLYSPEGLSASTGQTMTTCGPEGLTWEMQDGRPVLTDFGVKCFIEGDADMPEEWGGGKWLDGSSQLNFKAISAGEINPNTGFTYDYTLWDSYQEMFTNDIVKDWQEFMGAKNQFEFYNSQGRINTTPGSGFAIPPDSTEVAVIREQVNQIVVEYSWRAVFANSEAEFDSLIAEMKSIVDGLGYAEVVAMDMESTRLQKLAREAVIG